MLLLWFVSAQAISFAQDPYPSDADEIKWRQINMTKEDVLNKAINTIDLGEYKTEKSSIRPNINAQGGGLDYRSQSNGTLFTLSSKYNEQNGLSFGGVLATPISKNTALGVLLNSGSDRNEWLVNAGWDIDDHQRVIGTLGQLRQKLDFSFISGVEKAQITQNNAALSYQYLLGRTLLNSAELNAYISDTQSLNLADKTFYTDTASLYELWNDRRRIAGGRVEGFQGRMVFTPNSRSTFKLGLGAEKLSYDLLVGHENYLRATGSAELNQQLSNGFNLTAAANLAASQDKFALGLSKTFNEGYQLGVNIAAIRGRDNTFDDNQLTINFTQFLGVAKSGVQALNLQALNAQDSSVKTAATDSTPKVAVDELSDKPKAQWTSSLVNAVSKRPTFLPSQVNAKVDTSASPIRLIAIDKTQIPTGSTIDKASGVLTVPIQVSGVDVPVSAIASVTKNAGVFTNSGQFALSGSTYLVINPNLITQPTTNDTYVVTMNNTTGGGTTLATITVSHGSTRIDSVVISSGTITTVLSNFAVPSQTYGAAAFTITPPNTNNPSGAFSYTSTNTSVATISGTTVTLVGAGTSTITAIQAANGNYSSGTISTSLNVAQATTQLTGLQLSASSVVYGATAPIITPPTSASNGAISYSSSNVSVVTISGSTINIVGVGAATITATQASTVNYASTTTTADLTVTQATQAALNLTANPDSITAATGTSALSVTGGSGTGAVSYALTSGNCILSGNTLTAGSTVGLNVCSVTATKAADANYTSVTSAPVNITVTAIGTVATPTFSTSAGAIAFNTTITLVSATGADAIYYTTNGTDPTTTESATNFKQSSTPLVITSAVTVKALAVKAGYTNSAIASAAYTQAQAAAPSSVTLSMGSSSPVGTITNVVMPAVGGTDTTGAVRGWETGTADKIKFTVANGVGASSSITINGAAYTSGTDYTIASTNTLSVVVTSAEAGKSSVVMTFTITVAAIETPIISFGTPTTSVLIGGAPISNLATSNKTGGNYGAITYSSSDTTVATVDVVTGVINSLRTGTTIITATQAAVAGYNKQVTSSYTLTVSTLGTVATPTFSTSAGAIAFNTTITLVSATGADAIYYTTNGTDPTTTESATNFKQSSTPLVITSAVTVKALAVKAGYTNSAIASAAYTQAQAAAPSSVSLSPTSITINGIATHGPIQNVTDVVVPQAGSTDSTGQARGWVATFSDTIKFTVVNSGSASSTIKINGNVYVSGSAYSILSANDLTIEVTTTEAGKSNAVRTFIVSVLPTPQVAEFDFISPSNGSRTWTSTINNVTASISGNYTYNANYGGGITFANDGNNYGKFILINGINTAVTSFTISMALDASSAANRYNVFFDGSTSDRGSPPDNSIWAMVWQKISFGKQCCSYGNKWSPGADLSTTPGINGVAWYDFVYSGSTVSVYINGVLYKTAVMDSSNSGWNAPLMVGNEYGVVNAIYQGNNMVGTFYRIKYQQTALDSAGIVSQYNSVKGTYGLQ